ncbi:MULTISPECIES: glycosyltransferase [Dietzia]|nr:MULTISPECIES: glycosyltransferase [unclassified Dietzia]MBB1041389.1 glycosyltransferase [Dietzia sp. Cai40]MBB1044687.1 glycosyltransferase [Dietzia sp. DQ11-44]MBB1050643.1 glycosyltransferase [Dietzia sp. CW19]MBB1053648.1 glycosyltransferase [Dietzia sp. B44]MBB1056983.1 glycosyltransferase [Dietzia sp. B19]
MRDPELSVLLTVYHAIAPSQLRDALDSVHAQTVQPAEVIVVEDGPLSPALREVLDSTPDLRRFALPQNLGAAAASQRGFDEVRTSWVARQDADDISLPERFERQLDAARTLGVDVLGSAMLEFDTDPEHPKAMRALPTEHEDIARYARINNPVNNPSLLARTDAIRAVGGYRHVPYQEDYDLMIRLIGAGYRLHNLPEPLVKFRVTDAQFSRRKSRQLTASERTIQRTLLDAGMISRPRAVANYLARNAYRRLPAPAMNAAYRRIFHS